MFHGRPGSRLRRLGALIAFPFAIAASSPCARAADPHVEPNAPVDCAASFERADLQAVVERLSPEAMKRWPTIRSRYLAGLEPGQSLFVTILLEEQGGNSEYVFVAVDGIEADKLRGRIWNDIVAIHGLQRGSSIELTEDAISDWLISNPDGSEEGNVIGKAVDEMEQCRAKGRSSTGATKG